MAEPCGVYCVQKKVRQFCPRPRVDGTAVCQFHFNLHEGRRRRIQELQNNPILLCQTCNLWRRREGDVRCKYCIQQANEAAKEAARVEAAIAANQCGRLMTGRKRYCKRARHEGGECKLHQTLERQNAERRARLRALAEAYRMNGGRNAFSNDSQNVHRREVTFQTNSLLSELATAADTGALAEIAEAWKEKKGTLRVLEDMRRWQNLAQVRRPEDWAYRRMLHVVWDKIKASPQKDDLVQRLQEEASEAVGQCAEGHIGRLANTLYGYDGDTKAPEISRSEQLQNRMPEVMDIEDDTERKTAAENLLREVGLPEAEWGPWIDAVMA